MCQRFTNQITWRELVELYRIHDDQPALNLQPRHNVAPTQEIPIVRSADDARELVMGRWGLAPFWAKEIEFTSRPLINAKAETVDQKPTFRNAFRHRHTLFPPTASANGRSWRMARSSPIASASPAAAPSPSPAWGRTTRPSA